MDEIARNETPTETSGSDVSQPDSEAKSGDAVRRAMKKMADRAPDEMIEMTAMMGGMMGHPLHQKMNEVHITKMLDLAIQHDTNEFELRKNQQRIDESGGATERTHKLVYFCIFIALLVLILSLFRNQPTLLVPILTGVGGVVSGFIGGIGYARANPPSTKGKSD